MSSGLDFKKKKSLLIQSLLSVTVTMSSLLFPAKLDPEFQFFFLNLHSPIKSNGFNITESFLFWISYTGKLKMIDDILQKQVLSSTIEFRVSDTVQEFKMFNKSLFLHLPCVINHMAAQ